MNLLPFLLAIRVQENDTGLVLRLKNRDPEAMAELYGRYGRLTYSLVLRMVRNQALAEDLVQETFLRVWNRVQAFDHEKGSIGTWLLAVARNRAIDHLRSPVGRRTRLDDEFEESEHPSLFANLEAEILGADEARRLRDAVSKLTPNQRQVIELAYFEGLSQSEMAERLGQPLGTVKTWVRGGLQKLRDEMRSAAAR
ncbi:MAG: sigma-70 family RNA polymerase sigma factor [Bryobacterales bacterium]|nr:sigma-70 family RNA polymerase sigma factor [Bryobacterales bacterium]